MANFYDDNEDLKFYIEKYVDWESLVSLVENNFKLPDGFSNTDEATDFYRDFFSMLGNFVADEIAPKIPIIEKNYLKLVDGEVVEAPELTKIFEQMHEMGLHGLCLPREFGGMNAPLLCYMLGAELIARADVSIMTHHSFHGGMSLAMLLFSAMEGSTEIDHETQTMVRCRFQKEIEDMVTNGTWGAMDITEPNAGSDMGALRSKGEQERLDKQRSLRRLRRRRRGVRT